MEYDELKTALDELEDNLESIDQEELYERIFSIEGSLTEESRWGQDQELFSRLKRRIDLIKRENDFYDPERELDRMFPDRHDDDFE